MDHQGKADELEGQADDMQRASEKLEQGISETRDEWRRKQADPSVPGADEADDDQLDREREPEARPPG